MEIYTNDIPKMLHEFLSAREGAAFARGKNDCCLFVADWARIVTGKDPAAGLRGTYDTARKAERILKKRGGMESMIDAIAKREGWEKILPAFAQRGCIATIPGDDGLESVGIVTGNGVAGINKSGLRYVPLKAAIAAWRITA